MPGLATVLMPLGPVVIGAALLALVRRRGHALHPVRPVRDPVCPACGYRLAGVPGPACPECGRDLVARGVVDRADPPRGARAVALGLVLAGLLMLWVPLASDAIDAARPSSWKWRMRVELAVPPGGERLTVERTALATAHRRLAREDVGPGRIAVRLERGSGLVLLRADAAALAGADPAAVAARMREPARALVGDSGLELAAALAVALAGDPERGGRPPTARALRAAAAAATGEPDGWIAGTHEELVDWSRPADWPRAVARLAAAAIAGLGLVPIVRGLRRGAPVSWAGDHAAPGPRAPHRAAGGGQSVS